MSTCGVFGCDCIGALKYLIIILTMNTLSMWRSESTGTYATYCLFLNLMQQWDINMVKAR